MQITWVKPPEGGFILNEYTMEKKKLLFMLMGTISIMALNTVVEGGSDSTGWML